MSVAIKFIIYLPRFFYISKLHIYHLPQFCNTFHILPNVSLFVLSSVRMIFFFCLISLKNAFNNPLHSSSNMPVLTFARWLYFDSFKSSISLLAHPPFGSFAPYLPSVIRLITSKPYHITKVSKLL